MKEVHALEWTAMQGDLMDDSERDCAIIPKAYTSVTFNGNQIEEEYFMHP